MIQLAVGAAAGALVCLFGMWAFLRGQTAGMDAAAGARPRLTQRRSGREPDDLTDQVKALFAQPEETPVKRGDGI